MSRSNYNLDRTALLKIILHSLKYPTVGVNGILIGEEKVENIPLSSSPPASPRASASRKVVHIYDAVPVSHSFISLAGPLEIALAQTIEHCKRSGKSIKVVGYYQCNEDIADVKLGTCGRRIADRLENISPGSIAILLDGRALSSLITSKQTAAPVLLQRKDASRNEWTNVASSGPDAAFKCPVSGIADLLVAYIEENRHHRLNDFEDHLENISRDWLNNKALLD